MSQPMLLIQVISSGIMLSFLFALVAVGLTLIYGMMDLVNFAHGEMLMLGLYTAYWLQALFGLEPLFSLPACILVGALLGTVAYKVLIRHVLKAAMVAQMFSTFGLSVFIMSTAHFLWTPMYRSTQPRLLAGRVNILGVLFGRPQLVAGVIALIGFLFVWLFLTKTDTGRALQATAQDRQAASLMGIDTEKMFTLTWAIAGACAGAAGGLLANIYPAYPGAGFTWALTAYIVVVFGGFGSIPGALLGALVVGVVQTLSGVFIDTRLKLMISYLLFLAVLLFRPHGLLGKR